MRYSPTDIRFGKVIRDGKKPCKIRVEPEDIKRAVCRDHQKCAIARAIQRQTGAPWVDVGASVVIIGTSDNTGRRFLLDVDARKQVKYFDTHKGAMAPCKMVLTPARTTKQRKLGSRAGDNSTGVHGHIRSKNRAKPTR